MATTSRPAPVPAIMPSIAASIQAKSQGRPELAPTAADMVVAFGHVVPAHAVPGASARYYRGEGSMWSHAQARKVVTV